MKRRLVLASASPRRRELLSRLGIDFEVRVSKCEERTEETEPKAAVMDLAREKARAVARELEGSCVISANENRTGTVASLDATALVIGADTIVVLDQEILGKPKDAEDARRMLRELSGRSHHVYTGVSGIFLPEGREVTFAEETEVIVDHLSEEEIEAYLASGEPFDKAGAYGIQGLFGRHVRGIVGDYFNVVGLPVHKVYKMLLFTH